MNNGEMPASPQSGIESMAGDIYDSDNFGGAGFTKREKLAAMAMQAILSSGDIKVEDDGSEVAVAKASYAYADALLQEGDK